MKLMRTNFSGNNPFRHFEALNTYAKQVFNSPQKKCKKIKTK